MALDILLTSEISDTMPKQELSGNSFSGQISENHNNSEITLKGAKIIPTGIGPLLLIAREGCLIYCNWIDPQCRNKQKRYEKIASGKPSTHVDEELLEKVSEQIIGYFKGNRKEFDIPIKLYGTDFQKEVWNSLKEIAYGSTISYGGLAEKIGKRKAVRAIGTACGANPLAVILPCHRVVASGGSPGGYTGTLWRKLQMLSLESDKK